MELKGDGLAARLPPSLAGWYRTGWATYESWRADRTLRLGAGLAYYALFTLVPFIAITAAIAEPLIGSEQVTTYIGERLEALGVVDSAAAATEIGGKIDDRSTQTSLGVIGAVSLLFSASLLFLALTDAINTIWGEPVHTGWWSTIRRRLLSFAMVLISSVAIVLGLAFTAIVGAAERLFPGETGVLETLAPILTTAVQWAGLGAIVVLLLRYLSPEDVGWRVATIAGVLSGSLMIVATTAIGWYLREFGGSSVTGAFGAILALLTWVYVEAQIVLAGVQLSKVLTRRGSTDAAATVAG